MPNDDRNQGQDSGMQPDNTNNQSDKGRGGSFANDSERAAREGRKGGMARGQ